MNKPGNCSHNTLPMHVVVKQEGIRNGQGYKRNPVQKVNSL